MTVLHPTYDNIHNACVSITEKIIEAKAKPEIILGLARGGLVPAVILSHLLSVPMQVIYYSSKNGAGDNKNHQNDFPIIPQRCILLVDDICDSGKTLMELFTYYTIKKHLVYAATLHHKDGQAGHVPDFYHWTLPADSGWTYYPWEVPNGNQSTAV